MGLREQINRLLLPLSSRVRNMLARAVIKAVQDDKKLQTMTLSILAGELKSGIEHYQDYGLQSVPLPGMEALVSFVGGNRNNGVIIAVGDRQYRLKDLKGGEVALYSDEGDYIILKRKNNIEFHTKHLKMFVEEDYQVQAKKIIMVAEDSYSVQTKTANIRAETSFDIDTDKASVKASSSAVFDTPILSGTGDIKDKKSSMQAMRDIYNPHTHTDSMQGTTKPPSNLME